MDADSAWRDVLQRMEEHGFFAAVFADHFTGGWQIEPLVGLTAAALCTKSLRLQTGVLCNDYRHPVLTHRMAAQLDALSGGRLILGLGAGWMTSDYASAGIPFDPPGQRIARLEEAIEVIRGLFGDAPFSFAGRFYRIAELDGLPKPVQRPHPPLFIGGGSPRILRLAGRLADIAGISAKLAAGELGRHAIEDLSRERVTQKLGWLREGLTAAGRAADSLVIEMNHWLVRVTRSAAAARDFLEQAASRQGVDPELLAASPSVLVGTVEQCADALFERRETFGLSYVQLDAGFPARDLEELVPLVERLAGR
jgi:probable F420-dependent oxidoreductase